MTSVRPWPAAARLRGEKFHLTYTKLPGDAAEVGWRDPPGEGRTATLTTDRRGGYECAEWTAAAATAAVVTDETAAAAGGAGSGAAGADAGAEGGAGGAATAAGRPCGAALHAVTFPLPPHWALQLHAVHSYPVLDEDLVVAGVGGEQIDFVPGLEVHCYGS